jgi:predicted  nucleic acid-binding Zn-ribbon protein
MEFSWDALRRLVEKLKTIGFLERLFSWSAVKSTLIEANGELQKIISSGERLKAENSKIENEYSIAKAEVQNLQETKGRLYTENEVLKTSLSDKAEKIESFQKEIAAMKATNDLYLKRGTELASELAVTRQRIDSLEKNLSETRDENAGLKKEEGFRRQEHSNAVSSINQIREQIQKERETELKQRGATEIERIKRLKETWINHEENVKNRIKIICIRTGVEYVDRVPFKGKPDNTLKINGEYIIFDAKSPANDDLSNFPSYVRAQAESAIKYVKEEDVRREVFLVVPSNTLEHLENFEFKLSDYTVYVISIDSLEPMILALKRIEDYEFAEQLSPEERENICRVIGKFIHLSKRRIQIDGFFAKQFFELVYRSEADLSKELLEKVVEFERSEKLNPPVEKRAKQISLKELEIDSDKLRTEANQKGINTQDSLLSREINKLPLYATETDNPANKDQGDLFNT